MIHIYDANAFLRQSLNRGFPLDPRSVYREATTSVVPQVWVWDGPNHNDRRRERFAGYKLRDYTGQENIFAGLDVYKDLLATTPAVQVTVPDFEADDVCATLAQHYAANDMPVTVHTNDFDFYQLATNPLITLKGVKPIENVPPQYVPLYKAMRGDPSDKIPGIPGFGPKAWESMRDIWPVLDEAMQFLNADLLRAQPFTTKPRLWLSSDENVQLVFDYYLITHFYDVSIELIEKHTKVGVPNPTAATELFSRFML